MRSLKVAGFDGHLSVFDRLLQKTLETPSAHVVSVEHLSNSSAQAANLGSVLVHVLFCVTPVYLTKTQNATTFSM